MQNQHISFSSNLNRHFDCYVIRVATLKKLGDVCVRSGVAGAIYTMFISSMDDDNHVRLSRKEISDRFNVSFSGIKRAIGILVDYNMVAVKKVGRNHIYEILP